MYLQPILIRPQHSSRFIPSRARFVGLMRLQHRTVKKEFGFRGAILTSSRL